MGFYYPQFTEQDILKNMRIYSFVVFFGKTNNFLKLKHE